MGEVGKYFEKGKLYVKEGLSDGLLNVSASPYILAMFFDSSCQD